MAKMYPTHAQRLRRKTRVRKRISGTAERPRLTVFRSNRHMYAQLVDDVAGQTLAAASTVEAGIASGANCETAAAVGKALAERATAKGVNAAVFDRNGYLFHGKVKALADAAREAGLTF